VRGGKDESIVDAAALYRTRLIVEEEVLLNGRLRTEEGDRVREIGSGKSGDVVSDRGARFNASAIYVQNWVSCGRSCSEDI
jgi:hypothetical protein